MNVVSERTSQHKPLHSKLLFVFPCSVFVSGLRCLGLALAWHQSQLEWYALGLHLNLRSTQDQRSHTVVNLEHHLTFHFPASQKPQLPLKLRIQYLTLPRSPPWLTQQSYTT